MKRPRTADDFEAIRARMEELERERERAERNGRGERLDEGRWRVAEELRARVIPREKGQA